MTTRMGSICERTNLGPSGVNQYNLQDINGEHSKAWPLTSRSHSLDREASEVG